MENCLFCKMVRGEIKPTVVHETETVLVFRDIHPQAPIHVLVIPKEHIAHVAALDDSHGALAGQLLIAARDAARKLGVDERGFRLVMNTNQDAGQTVFHLHMHLLAGRALSWPPG